MTTPLFATTLVRADHVRSFYVRQAGQDGWEAAQFEDQRVVQQLRCSDWHRVELTLFRFAREIAELRALGWREAGPSGSES